MPQISSIQDFLRLAKENHVIALHSTQFFDLETVISLAERFLDEESMFLLESATTSADGNARYSMIGFDPLLQYSGNGSAARWNLKSLAGDTQQGEWEFELEQPLSGLATGFRKLHFAGLAIGQSRVDTDVLCQTGGMVGYLSYDAIKDLEPSVGKLPPQTLGLPECHFFLPRNYLILDQLSRKLTLIRYVWVKDLDQNELEKLYASECSDLEKLRQKINQPFTPRDLRIIENPLDESKFSESLNKAEFLATVDECLEQIRAGEIYQIQIGNRIGIDTKAEPFHIYRHLRMLNPSPYMVFYKFSGHHIICASPEMMVNVQGNSVTHRPIAGTRRRSWDPAKDFKIKNELAKDEKECAEHVMLVDLSRNDIGRIAEPGSVVVDELMVVEEYSHVFHLVSQVSGQLRGKLSPYHALMASFPNGTVCGAPKIRAMQIISRFEKHGREFYAGSFGVFDFQGNLRSTLMIRTIYVKSGKAYTQASAGVVYDSIPENEWAETRNKMTACLLAIQNTQ